MSGFNVTRLAIIHLQAPFSIRKPSNFEDNCPAIKVFPSLNYQKAGLLALRIVIIFVNELVKESYVSISRLVPVKANRIVGLGRLPSSRPQGYLLAYFQYKGVFDLTERSYCSAISRVNCIGQFGPNT